MMDEDLIKIATSLQSEISKAGHLAAGGLLNWLSRSLISAYARQPKHGCSSLVKSVGGINWH